MPENRYYVEVSLCDPSEPSKTRTLRLASGKLVGRVSADALFEDCWSLLDPSPSLEYSKDEYDALERWRELLNDERGGDTLDTIEGLIGKRRMKAILRDDAEEAKRQEEEDTTRAV